MFCRSSVYLIRRRVQNYESKAADSVIAPNRPLHGKFHGDKCGRYFDDKTNVDELHAFKALKDKLERQSVSDTMEGAEHQRYCEDSLKFTPSTNMSMPVDSFPSDQDVSQADPVLNKAVVFRNMLLDRIASENLYDIVKKNPAVYFKKAPFIDPNNGFRRADLLKKMQKCNFDLHCLNRNDLARAYKLDMLDLEKFLLEEDSDVKEHGVSNVQETVTAQSQEEDIIPWELVAMQNELQAMARGYPTLDSAECILKGKHITDPRQFTQEDIDRIREWDRGHRDREILNCALGLQQDILKISNELKESTRILQDTKRNVLEDEIYQSSIAEVQRESQTHWDNFVSQKAARPWKPGASDRVPFYGDRQSKVPKVGSFNIDPVTEQSKIMDKADSRKKHYTHYRVLKGREVRNSRRSVLTKNYRD